MFIPLKDDNQLRLIPFQVVTVSIIAACIGVFFWQLSLSGQAAEHVFISFGTIPSVLFESQELPAEYAVLPAYLTLVTSMFLHAGWLHLGGNMLYLWVFGDNVEDSMGHFRFILFYLLCGIAAALAHGIANANSFEPMVGASGAISGVLGAYLVMHPRVRVLVLAFHWLPLRLPAYIVLGGWIVLQLFNLYVEGSASPDGQGGVAWWAHVGGFVAGIILVQLLRRRDIPLIGDDPG